MTGKAVARQRPELYRRGANVGGARRDNIGPGTTPDKSGAPTGAKAETRLPWPAGVRGVRTVVVDDQRRRARARSVPDEVADAEQARTIGDRVFPWRPTRPPVTAHAPASARSWLHAAQPADALYVTLCVNAAMKKCLSLSEPNHLSGGGGGRATAPARAERSCDAPGLLALANELRERGVTIRRSDDRTSSMCPGA